MVRKEEVALLSDDGGGGGGSGTGELSSASTHKRQACTSLLAICVIVALPGAFQFGYASGVINDPEAVIRAQLDISNFEWACIVSFFCVGGAFGSQIGGKIADKYGRRKFLWFHGILFVISGLMDGLSPSLPAPVAWLILSRVFVGAAAGGATVVVPMYIGEISPQHLRGALTSLNQFACVVAILVSQILGYFMSTESGWPWLLAVPALLGAAQLLTGGLLVESPQWLVANGQDEAAVRNVCRLRGASCSESEAREIVQAMRASDDGDAEAGSAEDKGAPYTFTTLLRDKAIRKPLLMGLLLHITQQLSGINAVIYYSTQFFASAGIKNGPLGTLLVGAVNFLATGLAVFLMERTGRRPLIVWGSFVMFLTAAALTVTLAVQKASPESTGTTGPLAIVFVILFVAVFEFGMGPIPWAIGSEIFPKGPRATAMSLGASVNWFCNFLVALLFPILRPILQQFVFVPFAAMLFVCFVITLKHLPETKDRSIEQIQALFRGQKLQALKHMA